MQQLQLTPGFLLREIDGCCIAVPGGEAAQRFNGLLTLNETAAEVFRILQAGATRQEIIRSLASSFAASAETLAADVDSLLTQFRELGILQETAQDTLT